MESFRSTPSYRGVTVIELLVVLGIIGILVVVVVTSHATFNRTILLNYTTYDVALTIRSAETYGLGSRSRGDLGKNIGYGVHFMDTEGENDRFILFADGGVNATFCHPLREGADGTEPDTVEGDCEYDLGEEVETYTLGNNMRVRDLWYKEGVAWSNAGVESLDVVFARPNPQAFVSVNGEYKENASACVEISSPQGGVAHVVVERTGQIYVQGGYCAGAPAELPPGGTTGTFE